MSLFETTIRVLGGLLSAHVLAEDDRLGLGCEAPEEAAAPCSRRWYNGELLTLAADLGDRLLPAYYTRTGVPIHMVRRSRAAAARSLSAVTWCAANAQVNLRAGVPHGMTPITCVAAGGTSVLEMALLSRLTGNDLYERRARRALVAILSKRSR